MQFYENCANQKNWWRLAPRIRRLVPGGTKIPPGGYCYAKSTKNNIFRESTHHVPLVALGGQYGAARRFLLFQEPRILLNTYEPYSNPYNFDSTRFAIH